MKLLRLLAFCAVLPISAYAETYFQSPSGNIFCVNESTSVTCYIFETNKGQECKYTISANAKKARKECGYGELDGFVDIRTLAYGKSINGQGWTCTSQKSGMRCANKAGKGFFLSRAKQTLF